MTVQPDGTNDFADAKFVALNSLTTLCLVLADVYNTNKSETGFHTINLYVSALHNLADYQEMKTLLKDTLKTKFAGLHDDWAEQVINNLIAHWKIPPF